MGQEQGNQYQQNAGHHQFNSNGWSEPQSNNAGWSNMQSTNNNQRYIQQNGMPQQASGDCTQGGAVYNPAMGTNMGQNNGQPSPDCAGNNINWNPLNVNLNMFKIPEQQPDPNCKSVSQHQTQHQRKLLSICLLIFVPCFSYLSYFVLYLL